MATSTKPPINLQASYDDSQGWGIRIELGGAFSISKGDRRHVARISQRRETPAGKEGKPSPIFTLVAEPGETLPDLLRRLAVVWEAGEIAWPG